MKSRPNVLFIMADQLAVSALLWRCGGRPAEFGFVAPAGTPVAIVRRFNEQVNKALKSLEAFDRLLQAYAFAEGGTPEEFTKSLGDESARWIQLVKDANLKPE